jgi:hypothetical protein
VEDLFLANPTGVLNEGRKEECRGEGSHSVVSVAVAVVVAVVVVVKFVAFSI